MLKFNKSNLSNQKADSWISMNVNVLLIGEKGVGKTQRVLEAFQRNNLKYAYFSGSTLDPWVHLIGVPKVNERDGKQVLDFILPQNLDENVEAVFIDEYNRTPKIVRNAILELQQFKSINGRKFPKLRMVWAAINPPKDENDEDSADYDVEELDPAQMDRFQVIVELPNNPDKKYFKDKFGDYHGNCLVDWWKEQSKDAKKILSPRRLEYVGQFFNQGGDIADLLPTSANVTALIKTMSISKEDVLLDKVFNNPDEQTFKAFVADDKNYLKYRSRINNPKYWHLFKYLKSEYLNEQIKTNQNFQNYAIINYLKGEKCYISAVEEVSKSTKNDILVKVCKMLAIQKTDVTNALITVSNANNVLRTDKFGRTADTFTTHSTMIGISDLLGGNRLDVDLVWNNLQTTDYRTLFRELSMCYNTVPDSKYKIVASFVFAMLSSCQSQTLKDDAYFFKTFHNLVIKIKANLTEAEWKVCQGVINSNLKKFPTQGYIDNLTTITQQSGGTSGAGETVVSKDFETKIEQTFALAELMATA